ncbi:MAG: hypothetical protein WDM85_09840 [Caulobacteraceae bacterium]
MSSPAPAKRLYIKTYGCQMNVYDSERMADVLRPLGYGLTDAAEGADLVVLNTCHIREKATEKVYSELGKIKRMKAAKAEDGGTMLVAVAGCVAQAEGAEIMRRQPAVDLVVGPQSYHRLPELIARAHRGRRRGAGGGLRAGRKVRRPDCHPGASRRHRLPHRAGGLRQVLLVLRGAPTPAAPSFRGRRRRSKPRRAHWPRRACAKSPCWARTSTPMTVKGGPGCAGPALGEDPRPRPHPLHHPATRATWTTP